MRIGHPFRACQHPIYRALAELGKACKTVHELRAALQARECEVMDVERLDTPSPLPTPEGFMDTLDPIYRSFPTYRSLDEHLRGELRIMLAEEARRWIKEDVPAGRTAKVHL